MEDYRAPYIFDRILAKIIDFLIVGALFSIPTFVGPLAGLLYILIADGLQGGQSIGKRIVRIRVVSIERDDSPCDFRESALRNLPFGLLVFFAMIPYLRWILLVTIGIAIIAFETYMIYQDEEGIRWGDRIALTRVVALDSSQTS